MKVCCKTRAPSKTGLHMSALLKKYRAKDGIKRTEQAIIEYPHKF
jgi:hypothetical protein